MKIRVEHEVSPEKETCTHDGDFWGKSVCRYHTYRDRTHGRYFPPHQITSKYQVLTYDSLARAKAAFRSHRYEIFDEDWDTT